MCYTIPMAGAVVTSVAWARTKNIKIWWLNLMLYGGALFGVIDHLWNRELFLISENIVGDLLLGVAITAAIFLSWILLLAFSKASPALANYVSIKK